MYKLIIASVLTILLALPSYAEGQSIHDQLYAYGAEPSTTTLKLARRTAYSGQPEDRRAAMEFFYWQAKKYANSATKEIVRGLEDQDATVRAMAAAAFKNLTALHPNEVEHQLANLWKRDRFAAALASAHRGIANEAIARELLAGIVRPEPFGRDAIVGFKVLGSSAAAIVRDDLIKLDSTKDNCIGLYVLAETHTAPASLVPRMHELVKRRAECSYQAASVLGAIGPAAARAIPDLIDRIQGVDGSCCSAEAEYLVGIGTASVPALLKVASEKDPFRRMSSAYALARLGGKDLRAGQRAIAALDDENFYVRSRVQYGLSTLGESGKQLAPLFFRRMLKSEKLWMGSEGYPTEPFRLLIPTLPVDSKSLYKDVPLSTSGLSLTLSPPRGPADSSHAIHLQLRMKNTRNTAIRLVKSDCSVTPGDPVELILVMNPGWLILRRNHRWHSSGIPLTKDDGTTTVLQPGESREFDCVLQAEPDTDPRRHMFAEEPWAFDYYAVGLGQQSLQLRPGRYHIRAHYRLRPNDQSAKRHWSTALEASLGKLWEGDAYSNDVVLEVK